MPDVTAINKEFLLLHRFKIQKLHQNCEPGTNKVLVSNITKNHWYPQINKTNGKENAYKFLSGMEANGLGQLIDDKKYFEFVNVNEKENIGENTLNFLNELNII